LKKHRGKYGEPRAFKRNAKPRKRGVQGKERETRKKEAENAAWVLKIALSHLVKN